MKDRIVAHRGYAAKFRENSSQAIRSALAIGCKYIEVDVQLSADGMPMLSHDDSLQRVFHLDRKVTETRALDLKRMGVEPLFHAVKLCEVYRATLFVEIKRDSWEKFGERAVSAAVSHANGYVFISFCLDAVLYARCHYGERIGWVLPDLSEQTREKCEEIAPDYLFCDQKLIPRNATLWPGQWVAYEVQTRAMADDLCRCGVSLFETKNVRGLMCSQS